MGSVGRGLTRQAARSLTEQSAENRSDAIQNRFFTFCDPCLQFLSPLIAATMLHLAGIKVRKLFLWFLSGLIATSLL